MTYYYQISMGYNELYREEQLKKIALIKKHCRIKSSNIVLDIGCGPCYFSDEINAKVIGIDPCFELLKIASNTNIKICGRAEFLPFKHKTFDVIVSITAIHNFSDVGCAISEMKKVGKTEWIISVLKKSSKKDKINSILNYEFAVKNIIEEEKDIIYFCSNQRI